MYTLQALPIGTKPLAPEQKETFRQILNKLRILERAPFYGILSVSYSTPSSLQADIVNAFYRELDHFMFNAGVFSTAFASYYFTIQPKHLQDTKLDFEVYTSGSTFATRVLLDTKFNSNTKLHYTPSNFTEMKGLSLHLQETTRHTVKVLKTDTTLLVLTNKFTWQMYFKLKAIETEIFKNRFHSYNKDVVEAYTALATNDLDKFNKYINKILNYKTWFNLKKIQLRSCFENKKEKLLEDKQELIYSQTDVVDSYETRYLDALSLLERYREEYNLMLLSEETVDFDEIIEYLDRHRYIEDVSKHNEETIRLTIKAPILYYDQEYVESYRGFKTDGMEYVMNEVFVKNKYRLWTYTEVLLNTTTFKTSPIRQEGTIDDKLAHPHVSRYGCQGNHIVEIRKWLQNRDYIGCIEQIMTMIFNLNWTDGIVINTMLGDIRKNKNKKMFEVVGTGDFVSYNEILETKE